MSDPGSIGARFTADQTAKRRRRSVALIAVFIAACLLVVGVVATLQRKAPAISPYRTETASRGAFSAIVTADGDCRPEDTVSVFPPQSGTVARVDVELGDTVVEGQPLYVIRDGGLKSRTAQAKASLGSQRQQAKQAKQALDAARQAKAQAEAGLLQAQQNLDAARSLPATSATRGDQVALATKQLDAARLAVRTAESGVVSARSAVEAGAASADAADAAYAQARADQDALFVRAPAAGQVMQMDVGVGQPVNGAGPSAGGSSGVVVIADPSHLKVRVAVSENDRVLVKSGQKASVTLDAVGATASGTVTWIAPAAANNQGVVQYMVDIAFDAQPKGLSAGMSATAAIVTGTWPDALTVPNAAVRVEGSANYVLVLADGVTKRVAVTIGSSSGGRTRIVSGLRPGDVVVLGRSDAREGAGSGVPNPLNPGASF